MLDHRSFCREVDVLCLLPGSVENMEDFVTLDELAEDEDESEHVAENTGR